MCAIAGILGHGCDQQIAEQLLRTMHRRGPDGEGYYQTESFCLLHSRLSIVDLAGGAQPMILDHGKERYVITYNGELYNTEELRRELIACGHEFDGHSDTEVLLHGYAQWKEKVLEKCNGIFAFAVLEEYAGRIFMARDRIGVKPLFYRHTDEGLLFASEIKTILAYPGVRAELDEEGIAQLLLLGPGRMPGSGVFCGIRELEPGCYGIYESGKLKVCQYWELHDRIHEDSFEETAEKVRYLVLDAICRQMVSDVPIGTFLSGGLDSSLISSVCARQMDARGLRLDTFSVDYLHNEQYFIPGKFQPNSDTEYIRIMQEHIDSQHHWTVLTPQDLLDSNEEAVIARDLPGMADVDSSLLLFCQRIRPFVKVALSGECADELFGGYPWFRDAAVKEQAGFPWSQNIELRSGLLPEWLSKKLDAREFIRSAYTDTLKKCDILPENDPQEVRMKQMTQLNFKWFMQTLLDRKDRMSMYQGLEVRVPFCDYRIAEYLYAVPWEFKDHKGQEKGLLRYAMRGILPESILYRKKSPYPKTYDPAYLELVRQQFKAMLDDRNAPIKQIVNGSVLQSMAEQDLVWPWYGQLMSLPQTLVYLLQINFWMKHYSVQIS